MHRERKQWMALAMLAGLLFSQPALANTETKENVVVLPYIALGGEASGWHFITGLSIRNSHSDSQWVKVQVFDNDWDPLPVILNGESELAAETTWTIPPEDSREFVLTHPGQALLGGWIRMATSEQTAIRVVVVVRFYNGDALILETGISTTLPKQDPTAFHTVALQNSLSPWRRESLL